MTTYLAKKDVKRLMSSITENKSGAEINQTVKAMLMPLRNKIFILADSAKRVPAGSTKLSFSTRQGWTDSAYTKNDYDYLGLQGMGFLSEQIFAERKMSSEFEYDIKQLQLLSGVEGLESKVTSLIQEEFIENIERKLTEYLYDAIDNGITETIEDANGNPYTETANAKTFNVSFDTPANIAKSMELIKKVINRLQKINNPMMLRPKPSDYILMADTDIFPIIENDTAFRVIGGDEALKMYLGNAPIGTLSQMPVIKNPNMRSHTPLILVRKELLYLHLGDVFVRSDYIAKSRTRKFWGIEAYYDFKLSFHNTKFDGIFAFKLATTTGDFETLTLTRVKLNEVLNDRRDGTLSVSYDVTGKTTGTLTAKLYDNLGYSAADDIVIDIATAPSGTLTYNDLGSWTYRVEIYEDGNMVEFTNYIQVQDKASFSPLSLTSAEAKARKGILVPKKAGEDSKPSPVAASTTSKQIEEVQAVKKEVEELKKQLEVSKEKEEKLDLVKQSIILSYKNLIDELESEIKNLIVELETAEKAKDEKLIKSIKEAITKKEQLIDGYQKKIVKIEN